MIKSPAKEDSPEIDNFESRPSKFGIPDLSEITINSHLGIFENLRCVVAAASVTVISNFLDLVLKGHIFMGNR